MIKQKVIDENILSKHSTGKTLADKAKGLLQYQKESWELLSDNYKKLEKAKLQSFQFYGFTVKVQSNPARIISTSAKVDESSINSRKCFLCYKNLYDKQKGLPYYRDYLILCNPYPILPEHFTLTKIDHVPQNIKSNFESMLNLSKDLGKYYSIYYNGPQCGASAPDHMHFQAGTKFYLPVENEYESIKNSHSQKLMVSDVININIFDNYLRKMIVFESNDKKKIIYTFDILYSCLDELPGSSKEPMMNIISSYENNKWRIIIFPRSKHRPD
jgi:galactose-1-phosphate uridylyltransferase